MKKVNVRIGVFVFVATLVFGPSCLGASTAVLAACGAPSQRIENNKAYNNLAYSPSTGGNGGSSQYAGDVGGVALDKAATFLADMSDVKGAYFDESSNRIVFVGSPLTSGQTPMFNKDDLAVAIRSVVFNNTIPAVSIGDPNNPYSTSQPVQYTPGIADTNFGDILEKADYKLKKYSFGYEPDGTKVTSSVPGYMSMTDRYLALQPEPGDAGSVGRLWITPNLVSLKRDNTTDSFVFDTVSMQVLMQLMPGSSPKGAQSSQEFAAHMTQNYDAFAQENEWFAKTKDLSKIVAVVKWLKDTGIVTDYEWAKNYKPTYVDTADTVQFYNTPPIPYGQYTVTAFGGIQYTTPNTYSNDNGQSASIKTASESAAPSELADHWNFTQNNLAYKAVAVSANAFRAVGGYSTGTTDLSIDTAGYNDLAFSRTYSSLASTSGEIGNGWEFVKAKLTNPEPFVGVLCFPAGGYQGIHAHKLTFQTQDGVYETFTYDCGQAAYLPDKAYYNSVVTKLADGSFTVKLKNQVTFRFEGALTDSRLKLVVEQDKNGNTINYDYNNTPYVTAIRDSQNRSITINRNAQGVIGSIADWSGRTVSYSYDNSGNLTSVTDPRGNTIRYAYTAGLLTGITDRQNRTLLTNQYDGNNRVMSTTNSSGVTVGYAYDEDNQVVMATDNNQRVGKVYYDDQTRVLKQVDPLNNYTQYTYGMGPWPLTIRDKNANTTTFTYNDWGDNLSVTYPNAKQVTKQYNSLHQPTVITDGRYGSSPKTTTNTYDAKGNLLSVDESGVTTQYTYDAAGNMLTRKDGLNHQTTYTYDSFGHALTATNPVGTVTTNTYDSIGRIGQRKDADNKITTYTYDSNSNLLTTATASGVVSNTYNADNKITQTTDPNGKTTQFAYSTSGSLTSTTDALSHLTGYGYDQYDNLTTRQDVLNHTTQYAYDQLNRKKQSTTPLGKVAKWEYDANGNLIKRIDESNRSTAYEYDSLNQLKKITYPDSSTVTYTYDDRGNLLQSVSPAGISAFTYDVRNRLTSETDPNNATITYTYDATDNLTQVKYPDNKTVNYTYDAANRLQTVSDWNNQQTTYQYNANGTTSSKALPNSISATYGYDQSNRLSSIEYKKSQNLVTKFNYLRDANGNITKETQSFPQTVTNYVIYDEALRTGWSKSWSWDSTINLSNTTTPYADTKSITWQPNAAWAGLHIRATSGSFDTTPYNAISFAMKATQAGQKAQLVLKDLNDNDLTQVDLALYGGNLSTSYKVYTVPLSVLNGQNKQILGLNFIDDTGAAQPKLYIDNLQFTTAQANPTNMYDDAYVSDFEGWGWNNTTIDPSDASMPYSGSKALGITLGNPWGGVAIYDWAGVSTLGYESLTFALKGSQANQNFTVQLLSATGDGIGAEVPLASHGGVPDPNAYKVYTVPLTAFGVADTKVYGIILQDQSGQAQPKILMDDIKLLPQPSTGGTGSQDTTFTYDNLGRLLTATYPGNQIYTYTYDAAGNRTASNENGTQSTYTVNGNNQVTAKASRSFTYDNQGNRTTDGAKTLGYNFDNLLTSLVNGSQTTIYKYDGLGNRLEKSANGTPAYRYVNDTSSGLSRVLVASNLATSTNAYYVYGKDLLSQGDATSASRQYYLEDGMGNVRLLTDNTGTALQTFAYDPFGNQTAGNSSADFRYQHEQQDTESGLTYLRARYYDPTTGNFTSHDPVNGTLGNPQTQNGYSYAGNNPINYNDPSGKFWDIIWDAGNVVYDLATCSWGDAAADAGAAFIPFVPTGGTKAIKALGAADDAYDTAKKIPGNPWRGADAPQQAYSHLQDVYNIDPAVSSNRLHRIKESGGVGAADNVVIGRTGDVYNEKTGEFIGSLTNPMWGH